MRASNPQRITCNNCVARDSSLELLSPARSYSWLVVLFPDTETAENLAKQIIGTELTGNFPQRLLGVA